MNFEPDTLSKVPAALDTYGARVSSLLNTGEDLRGLPFAFVEKKMLGGKGELFLRDRCIRFRSNGGFNKL
ncbi:MAG: hypothetical protein AVO35_10720 [Candidatus Aegiribacteria sp. MLS_C]|nr:MAG: hypothetical protein AVO35_10720 [Candidatus Aegiribacteria sp. MLS_C]